MARLIKTEKEVEGRYTEQWVVVDEDALEQWPAGPARRPSGGPRRGRTDTSGHAARRSTPPTSSCPACCTPRSCAALMHERGPEIDLRMARAGTRRARSARSRHGPLTDEPAYQGAPVAAVAADTDAQARAAMRLIEVEWEVLEPLLDPDEAVRRSELVEEPNHDERGDIERGLAEADVVVEAEYRTQSVLHNSMETHQSVCQWEGDDRLTVYISTQFVWGVRERVAKHFGLPADHVRVVCRFMGGGFGSKNGPGDYTFVGAELARKTGRPVKSVLTRREENLDAGQSQRHDPAAADRRPHRRDAHGARRRVRQLDRLGRLARLDRRADADALRLRERPDRRVRRQS